MLVTTLAGLALGFFTLATGFQHVKRQNNNGTNAACATGVHMIIARASTEAPGEGAIGAVATMVKNAIPGSDSEAVDYPATLTDYQNSEASGVAGMQKSVTEYATRCPNSKIALMGYSQGAQVAGDVVCGTSSAGFTATSPMSADLSSKIVAMVQMGDPTYVPGQPQDAGTSKTAGLFPRLNLTACPSNVIAATASYCNTDDEFCASGSSLQVHLAYITANGNQSAQFIMDKVSRKTTTTPAKVTQTKAAIANTNDAGKMGVLMWGLVGSIGRALLL